MATSVHNESMGRKTVVTRDKYGNERVYRFKVVRGVARPIGDGRDYTPPVLKALWNDGVPVDWSPDELTPSELSEIDGFCDECGESLKHEQVGPTEFETYCPEGH